MDIKKESTNLSNLRWVRLLQQMTQDELALKSDVLQSQISKLERRLIKPSDREKKSLAKALGCQPEKLFPDNKES